MEMNHIYFYMYKMSLLDLVLNPSLKRELKFGSTLTELVH